MYKKFLFISETQRYKRENSDSFKCFEIPAYLNKISQVYALFMFNCSLDRILETCDNYRMRK